MKSVIEQCAKMADRNITENEFIHDVLKLSGDKNRDVARAHAVSAMHVADGLANLITLAAASLVNMTVSRGVAGSFTVVIDDRFLTYTQKGLCAVTGYIPPRDNMWDKMISSIILETENNANSRITVYPYTWTLDGNESANDMALSEYKGSKVREYPTATVISVPSELLDLVNRATWDFHSDRVIVKDMLLINGVPGIGEDRLSTFCSSDELTQKCKEEFDIITRFISEFEKTLPSWVAESRRCDVFTGKFEHQNVLSPTSLPLGNSGKGSLTLVMHIE